MKKQILFLSFALVTSSFYAANTPEQCKLIDEQIRIVTRVKEIDQAITIATAKSDMPELMAQHALFKQAIDQLREINTLFEELERENIIKLVFKKDDIIQNGLKFEFSED